ncbi:MAG: hypothetical protein ACOYEW_12105 [Anaerolineae bacterium]
MLGSGNRPPPDLSDGSYRVAVVGGCLFGLVLSVYLLAFSGRIHAIDEYSSLATVSSLLRGRLQSDQMAWAWAGDTSQDALGQDGHLYSKKGIGVALWALPFAAAGAALTGGSITQPALVSSLVATALGALAIYLAGVALTRSPGTAALLALLYGLGTIAFAYSKFIFGEALATMGMALAVFGIAHACYGRPDRPTRGLVLAGIGLGVAALARVASLVAVPFALAGTAAELGLRRRLVRAGAALLLPVAAALGLMAYLNWVRYGDPLTTGYAPAEAFSTPLVVGLRGLLLSWGKSVFVYSPPLLLALVGAVPSYRRHPGLVLFSAGASLAHLLLYAAWYTWAGGWSWGPRFLTPTTALLMPLALPLLGRRHRWSSLRWTGLTAVATLGLAVQVGAMAVDYLAYGSAMMRQGYALEDYYTLARSPALGHLTVLNPLNPRLEMLDPTWARAEGAGPLLLVALACVGGCGLLLAGALRGRVQRGGAILAVALPAVGIALTLALCPAHASPDAPVPLVQALEGVARQASPDDAVVVELLPYLDCFGRAAAVLDRYPGPAATVMTIRGEPQPSAVTQQVLAATLRDSRRAWLVLEATPIGDPASTTERWLAEHAYLAGQFWAAESRRVSVYYSGERAEPIAEGEGGPMGDGLQLTRYSPALSRPGTGVRAVLVELEWQAVHTPGKRYTVFVQLLGPDGRPVAQADYEPLGGLMPTDSWQPGQVVVDRYALPLPEAGPVRMIAGLYDPATGARLPAAGGDHFLLADQAW